MTRTPRRFAFSLALVAIAASSAMAQNLAWRTDYNAARREAAEKGRPILLDFGTSNCFWCKKLDATTFRDPSIVAVLTEHFVLVKIDAEREPALTQKLQITSFPTLVLAAPDGKIITVIEGFLEANRMIGPLNAVVAASLPTPEWMVREYQEASKAIGLGENARALALLKTILEDGKARPLQVKAREHLRTLEQQADNRLTHARKMEDAGQSAEAIETLSELLRTYPGTPASGEAKGMLTKLSEKPENKAFQRGRRAADLMAQARDEFRTQQFFTCLEKCELIAATFADTAEAAEAAKLLAEIRANPEWLARACNNLNERLTSMYLALADSWLKKGKPDEASVCLEKVRQLAPGSHHAQMAQVKLGELQGRPGLQADFKKP